MQNYPERIEDLNALEEVVDMMESEIRNVRQQAEETQDYAPDAAQAAIESLHVAQQNLNESRRRLDEARGDLNRFLDLARKKAHDQAEKAYVKLERTINAARSKIQKTDAKIQKAQSKVKIAKVKAESQMKKEKNEKVRINMTLPEYMRDEWKDLSEDLSTSVSQMIREAMTLYTSELKSGGNLERGLTKFGAKMEKVGKQVEDYVQNNIQKKYDPITGDLVSLKVKGREVLDKDHLQNLKIEIPDIPIPNVPNPVVPPVPTMHPTAEVDLMKKRVTGLIRIQKAIPIDKLAQALEISEDDAENIIYELAAEGVDGDLKNGVFKFKADPEEIIEIMNRIIDRL